MPVLTAKDYANIQRMIDATLAHAAGLDEVTECDLATGDDIDTLRGELESQIVEASDIHALQNDVERLQSTVSELEQAVDDIDQCQ